MVGKAETPSDSITAAKLMNIQTEQNYGLLRSQDEGAPRQRSYSIGTANNDLKLREKLSVRGGVMLGALGFKGLATSELAASGILDTNDYNCPRLYITNTALYDLKVLIPTIKDGQELWIRNNSASAFNITNTSGTGDQTTGNIELMAGTTYAFGVDDWICFHYDGTDSKFKQVTVGKNNIGASGSGEVFTWTNNHSAAQFNLNDVGAIQWTAAAANDCRINAPTTVGFQYIVDNTALEHIFFIGSASRITITNTSVALKDSVGTSAFSVGSSGISNFHNNNIINVQDLEIDGDVDIAATKQLGLGTNHIQTDSTGNLEYSVASSADDHEFFVGGVGQASIQNSGLTLFNRLNANGNNLEFSGKLLFQSTGTITGSDVGFASLAGSLYCNVESADSFYFRTNGTTRLRVHDEGIEVLNTDSTRAWLSIDESTTAPTATNVQGDECKLFCVDSGAGKTILKVQFTTGSPITLATEV